jgi:hypothetical protein
MRMRKANNYLHWILFISARTCVPLPISNTLDGLVCHPMDAEGDSQPGISQQLDGDRMPDR